MRATMKTTRTTPTRSNGLHRLAGGWSEAKCRQFEQTVGLFGRIDKAMWQRAARARVTTGIRTRGIGNRGRAGQQREAHRWKADIAASMDTYNEWFVEFAPARRIERPGRRRRRRSGQPECPLRHP